MLTQGKFLISYQIFDNIQVNNIGQTHVREILKDTQAFTINYRTEQIRDYLRYPGEELIPEHLHMINALKEIQNYWNLTSEKVIITDIIPIRKTKISFSVDYTKVYRLSFYSLFACNVFYIDIEYL